MAQTQEQWEKWYAKNGDKCRQRSRDWYEAHKARARAKSARYRANHPERAREVQRKWSEANPKKKLLARTRHRAKKNGLSFDLTLADIFIPEVCPILGVLLVHGGRQQDCSASVDRIDNNLGYVAGNIIVVSWRANRLKSDATHEELALLAAFYRPKPRELVTVTACHENSAPPAT